MVVPAVTAGAGLVLRVGGLAPQWQAPVPDSAGLSCEAVRVLGDSASEGVTAAMLLRATDGAARLCLLQLLVHRPTVEAPATVATRFAAQRALGRGAASVDLLSGPAGDVAAAAWSSGRSDAGAGHDLSMGLLLARGGGEWVQSQPLPVPSAGRTVAVRVDAASLVATVASVGCAGSGGDGGGTSRASACLVRAQAIPSSSGLQLGLCGALALPTEAGVREVCLSLWRVPGDESPRVALALRSEAGAAVCLLEAASGSQPGQVPETRADAGAAAGWGALLRDAAAAPGSGFRVMGVAGAGSLALGRSLQSVHVVEFGANPGTASATAGAVIAVGLSARASVGSRPAHAGTGSASTDSRLAASASAASSAAAAAAASSEHAAAGGIRCAGPMVAVIGCQARASAPGARSALLFRPDALTHLALSGRPMGALAALDDLRSSLRRAELCSDAAARETTRVRLGRASRRVQAINGEHVAGDADDDSDSDAEGGGGAGRETQGGAFDDADDGATPVPNPANEDEAEASDDDVADEAGVMDDLPAIAAHSLQLVPLLRPPPLAAILEADAPVAAAAAAAAPPSLAPAAAPNGMLVFGDSDDEDDGDDDGEDDGGGGGRGGSAASAAAAAGDGEDAQETAFDSASDDEATGDESLPSSVLALWHAATPRLLGRLVGCSAGQAAGSRRPRRGLRTLSRSPSTATLLDALRQPVGGADTPVPGGAAEDSCILRPHPLGAAGLTELVKLLPRAHLPGLAPAARLRLLAVAPVLHAAFGRESRRARAPGEEPSRAAVALRLFASRLRSSRSPDPLLAAEVAWALLDEDQAPLLSAVLDARPSWTALAAARVPLWLRSDDDLRAAITRTSRADFAASGRNPATVALFFVLLGRSQLPALAQVFKLAGKAPLAGFMASDFSKPAKRRGAFKNGLRLISQSQSPVWVPRPPRTFPAKRL
ncbi:hypothetical protein FNF31_02603 [Cafeteria roenbergensis]|uniref:RAVE complex protein Rav1 C-terminal domain-containing protein n=1 Tax=Cafeteria roenbergensis TaxID=33653 RepID=A0A5A8DHF4_CAFRO|nr:hypothetical protein FNF31_02603 [Cafeteria roenbergensis]